MVWVVLIEINLIAKGYYFRFKGKEYYFPEKPHPPPEILYIMPKIMQCK